jgi:hypothetical protein
MLVHPVHTTISIATSSERNTASEVHYVVFDGLRQHSIISRVVLYVEPDGQDSIDLDKFFDSEELLFHGCSRSRW